MADDFDLGGFDEAYDISDFTTDPAQVGMASVDEGDALDYTQRTTIPGTNITGFISPQSYMETRGATATNPFPDSIFSRIFGAENVDYTNILGSDGVQDINNLRYRQAMGLPSLTTGQDFKMGDFYVGQPTMEGTVKEVPRGGIIDMIPGLSTITNLFGRNRGLPESSDAFKKEMAKSQQSVQPLTDIINSMTSGIGSLVDRFRFEGGDKDTITGRPIEPRGTELGDMNTSTAFIPDARVVVDDFSRPLPRTVAPIFLSDMDQAPMLRAGITSMQPNMSQEADMEVADALQLVPSEFQDVPTDLGSGIRIAPGSGANRFKFTTSTGANLPGLNPMSNVFDMIDARNLEKEVGRLTDEEREFLAGRRNRIVGTPPRFVTNVS